MSRTGYALALRQRSRESWLDSSANARRRQQRPIRSDRAARGKSATAYALRKFSRPRINHYSRYP